MIKAPSFCQPHPLATPVHNQGIRKVHILNFVSIQSNSLTFNQHGKGKMEFLNLIIEWIYSIPWNAVWIESIKAKLARIGIMEVIYVSTSCTLVKARPQTFRNDISTENSKSPTKKARNMVTLTAKYAAFGLPAPNSFEILVLFKRKHVIGFVMVNNHHYITYGNSIHIF